MALPIEFALDGSPVSQQTRRRALLRQWTQNVRNAAERHWDSRAPAAGNVAVSIVYIFDADPLDVDNIPKPIMDALKGLVYSDDDQVTDLICRKRFYRNDLQTADASPVFDEFIRGYSQFTYIRVSDAPQPEVPLWSPT